MLKNSIAIGLILFSLQTYAQNTDTLITHSVQGKETLYIIAKKYGVSLQNLKEENIIFDDAISVGQKLKIRVDKEYLKKMQLPNERQNISTNPPSNKEMIIKYRVRSGDTVAKIAKLYKTTPENISSSNPDINLAELKYGMLIQIRLQN